MRIDMQRLAPRSGSTARTIAVGDEPHQAVVIIDDFFADPTYVRDLALSLEFSDVRGTFPGYEARVSLSTMPLLERARAVAGEELEVIALDRNKWLFTLMDATVAPELRHYPHPHADNVGGGVACLAGLMYLNTPEQCRGGTAFYRHRESGIREARGELSPGLAAYMARHDLQTVNAAYDRIWHVSDEHKASMQTSEEEFGYLCDSNELWEMTALVEMKFNRFVLWDSYLIHNPYVRSKDFGRAKEERRLTQSIFFEVPGEPEGSG